jgi:hypothetical protein
MPLFQLFSCHFTVSDFSWKMSRKKTAWKIQVWMLDAIDEGKRM